MSIIVLIVSLFVATEMVVGRKAFTVTPIKTIKDGHGNIRKDCKNNCGGFGDGWGSLGGYCTSCKHDADVGCKCILNDCGKKYWAKSPVEKRLANARGRA